MKRFLLVLAVVFSFTSCMKSGFMNKESYTAVVTFEYPISVFRSDSTLFSTQTPEGFGFDVLNFYHKLDEPKVNVLGGFLVSALQMPKSGNTKGLNNRYRANVAVYQPEGNTYAVYYQNPDNTMMPKADVVFAQSEYGICTMKECAVTNTADVVDSIKKNFKKGDKMVLKATGYLKDKVTGEASITLAEYTEAKDSIMTTWSYFDLSKLGSVDVIDFEIVSTNPDVPKYFCMDQLAAGIVLQY